jgi:RimJ/RimL family protein N-acetyltransferase
MADRLRLLAPDGALLDAAIEGPSALGRVLGCEVAEGWEVFPGALRRARESLAADPAGGRWGTRFFVAGEPRAVVGLGGFKGPPREGAVEIGYAIAPGRRGGGLATAAARALVREAFADPEARVVVAHTRAEPCPSARVLEKAGFGFEGEVPDPGIGTAWRFRLERDGSSPT